MSRPMPWHILDRVPTTHLNFEQNSLNDVQTYSKHFKTTLYGFDHTLTSQHHLITIKTH